MLDFDNRRILLGVHSVLDKSSLVHHETQVFLSGITK